MTGSGRLYAYDVVRVVAMVFVVAVHTLFVIDVSVPALFVLYAACQAVFFTANALFFMLSGKFNIRERKTDADLKSYYLKRFRSFIIPLVFLFFVRTLYRMYPNYETIAHVGKTYVLNTLGAFGSIEYWFVFTLFGFLIVAPFLAPMISSMTPFSRKVFFGIGIGYNLFALVASNLGFDFSWGYLFSGFAFAFCVGAFVEDLFPTKKSRAWACLAGAGGLVVTVLLACNGWKNGIHDISPFYTLLAIGVYFAVLSLAQNARPSRFVSFLANHSFTVYLVHMMFLPFVTNAIPHWLGAASLATYAICVAITFALSVLCAVVLDAVLIKPAQRGFDWIVARCSAGKAASSHPNGRANPSRRRGGRKDRTGGTRPHRGSGPSDRPFDRASRVRADQEPSASSSSDGAVSRSGEAIGSNGPYGKMT